ncbi:MAG TPA: alpha/beta hydrolase [Xanthobacteraceae bacterium]|nr:alpha/beta hydrolase [Xanthobacteraceae bacterium]
MGDLAFVHRFEPGAPNARPLLLLHGTGGDENDLLRLGRMVAPEAPLLSPRGKVLEHGMPRFFRRRAEAVFDEADVLARAHELADFIATAREQYGLAAPVALGYSNGANVAAAVMLLRPEALAGGILLRAMVPLANPEPTGGLAGKAVLIVSGARDPIAAPANAARLKALLERAGAAVDHRILPGGHELSQADVTLARDWLQAQEARVPATP